KAALATRMSEHIVNAHDCQCDMGSSLISSAQDSRSVGAAHRRRPRGERTRLNRSPRGGAAVPLRRARTAELVQHTDALLYGGPEGDRLRAAARVLCTRPRG